MTTDRDPTTDTDRTAVLVVKLAPGELLDLSAPLSTARFAGWLQSTYQREHRLELQVLVPASLIVENEE